MLMKNNDILIIHGTDYKNMTIRLLEQAGLADLIGDRKKKIGMKPNLVVAKDPSQGATTHGELLEGVICYLQNNGFRNITIMEGSWVGDSTPAAFRAAGYDRISRQYGVELKDLQADTWKTYDAAGMDIRLCDSAAEVDFMINMPVLKGHCQTTVTCALKNNKGVIPNSEKRRFHTMGLHKPIAHLNTVARNDFILVDNICGDLDFEEGGNPVVMNRILAFLDPVLCDSFVCESMGYSPEEVEYITRAEQLGVGSMDISSANVVYLNEDLSDKSKFHMTGRVKKLASYTDGRDACSACFGSLIYALDRLQDRGELKKGLPPVAIGQGYKGQSGDIGVGQCTSCFAKSLKGCPPRALDMVEFLEKEWL